MESWLRCVGSSSLSKDQIRAPCISGKSLCLLLNCASSLVVLWVDSSPWMVRVTTKASAGIFASHLTLLISTVYSAAINISKRKLSPVSFWSPSEAFSPSGHTRPEKVWPCRSSHSFRSCALAPTTVCWVVSPSSAMLSDFYVLSRMFFSFLLAPCCFLLNPLVYHFFRVAFLLSSMYPQPLLILPSYLLPHHSIMAHFLSPQIGNELHEDPWWCLFFFSSINIS